MKDAIYISLLLKKRTRRKSFALLIDPDKVDPAKTASLIELAVQARVDYLFVGGSLVISDHLDEVVQQIKSHVKFRLSFFPEHLPRFLPMPMRLLYLVPDLRQKSGTADRPACDFCSGGSKKRTGNHFHRLYGD